jgi:GNAT superfamily N-acetyltransferase
VIQAPEVEFRDARIDVGDGRLLAQAMREEINVIYPSHDLEGEDMPRAGHAELSPPGGAFLVGYHEGRPVCCGGVKRLGPGTCELKRMYLVPDMRGRGVARRLLVVLEDKARELGYTVARLDTGPAQHSARALYESAGYAPIGNFNANPVANFWGEKPLA